MKKLPKGNLFCEVCLDEYNRLEDLGPDEELSDEDHGDIFCCGGCGHMWTDTTFEKKLANIRGQIDMLKREESRWLNLQRKYEKTE